MDRGTWQGTSCRVAKSRTRLKRLSTQSRKRSNSCYCSRLQVATWVSRIWSPGWESLSTQTQTSSSPQSLTIRRCGKTQRHPTTLGLESGWRFHSPVLSSPLFLVVVCFSFFLATCAYLLGWTTADILPAGVWWRRVSSLPRLGWGADHRETMALVGGQDGRAGGGERRGACMWLLLVLILCRNIAWLVELRDWCWCSASNRWTYSNVTTCTTGVPHFTVGSFASSRSLYSMVLW